MHFSKSLTVLSNKSESSLQRNLAPGSSCDHVFQPRSKISRGNSRYVITASTPVNPINARVSFSTLLEDVVIRFTLECISFTSWRCLSKNVRFSSICFRTSWCCMSKSACDNSICLKIISRRSFATTGPSSCNFRFLSACNVFLIFCSLSSSLFGSDECRVLF